MCGIAGVLDVSRSNSRPEIAALTKAMQHRGPDADGFYKDQYISLGHRRLAILDLSVNANQPFLDSEERYVLVFNGEIYNYRELRNELADYEFRTSSDTEVLMAAFLKWGATCVKKLKGMFAFAIWDNVDCVLYLFRDRLGVKPLYVYVDNKYFLFASEVRALLASGVIRRDLNLEGLSGYFSFQSFGYPSSPIKGILQVEAGSYLIVKGGAVYKHIYWEVGKEKPDFNYSNISSINSEVKRLFIESVSKRLVSDVPIGAFLSGGIDSSAVVGIMAELSTSKPQTFTVSFNEMDFDEAKYAKLVSTKFGTQHTTIKVPEEYFLDELENALSSIDTPSADGVNTYVVSKAIRSSGIVVALSGIGGDELFAGYPFFKKFYHLMKYRDVFQALHPIRKFIPFKGGGGSKGDRLASLLKLERCNIESIYPEFRRVISARVLQQITRLDPSSSDLEKTLASRSQVLGGLPLLSQVSAAELVGYTQQTLLKDTDQMSMAVSLEVREPFFDHDLVDFLIQVPDKFKLPKYPKSLLVESLAPLLPEEIVFRKKQGFLFPWAKWMRGELNSFCERKIRSISERDFINRDGLMNFWRRFNMGDPSINWTEIWLFIVLEFWMEKNNVN